MRYEDEKDYVMRIIKEAVHVLFSVLLGKPYTQVELQQENKYSVSGTALDDFKTMVDQGRINEAENLLLEDIDYSSKEDLEAAVLFYEYVGKKEERFLMAHDYTKAEVVDGLKQIAQRAGLGNIINEILE